MKTTGRLSVLLALLMTVVGLTACARPTQAPEPPPDLVQLPYLFELDFASELSEFMVPTRAPIDAHSRYRVNDRLQARLEQWLTARSDPDAAQRAVVAVRVLELTFDYEEIGLFERPPDRTLLASRELSALALISSLDNDDDGFHIPYETVKTATIRLTVSVRGAAESGPHELSETVDESVMHDDLSASWPYDYHTFDRVVAGLLDAAVRAVDGVLQNLESGR